MSFIWAPLLLSLLALPILVALYIRMQRRRAKLVAQYGNLGMVQTTGGKALGRRRHLPPLFFLLALAALGISLARPKTTLSLPRVQGTVVLTFDISGSMAAEDMKPNRMEAAKEAARAFVARQPSTVFIGVVAFSDSGLSVQAPTNDKEAVFTSINRLSPARGTSLANGIFTSLDAIELALNGEQTDYYSNRLTPQPTVEPTPVPRGFFLPAAIVLLSDGENNVQPNPLVAAQLAADRGVRIHTVGVGSPQGAVLKIDGFQVNTKLDEETLQNIAAMSSGKYYNAQTEQDLLAVYENLGTQLIVKPEETEVTSLFSGLGILFLLIGGVLSYVWLNRLP
jgi:Ca-activated chloride channel family protein